MCSLRYVCVKFVGFFVFFMSIRMLSWNVRGINNP